MRKQSNAGKFAEELCKKYPKASSRSLAKILYETFSEHFNSYENARVMLRSYRGENGKSNNIQTKEKITPRINIPASKNEERENHKLSSGKWLILNDIHFPYHCEKSLDTALNYGLANGFNKVLINGDMLDMYKLSRFDKDPRKPSINEEFSMAREFLKSLNENFDETIYKIGNHEDRWEKWLISKAPELLDCDDFQLNILLRFGEYQVKEVKTKQLIEAGNMIIAHGHELPATSGGVNPARTMFLKANTSIAVGHFHRTTTHVERNVKNHVTVTHSMACLCHLSPEYLPYNNWNNGFGTIEIEASGEYEFHNKKIINGKIY
jgi:predicted phosphodiesterase